MSFVETIEETIRNAPQEGERISLVPSPKLRGVVDKSGILGFFGQLSNIQLETEKEVIEDGKKMVVVAKWGGRVGTKSQIIISITESSISFIGNKADNQYIRLEGKAMRDSKRIEESLKNTFSNPQIIRI